MTVRRGAWQRPQTDATRYLSAGAQLDQGFAEAVLSAVTQPYQALGPCYGIDVERVYRSAKEARVRKLVRDGILAVLLISWLAPGGFSLFAVPLLLIVAWAVVLGELLIGRSRVLQSNAVTRPRDRDIDLTDGAGASVDASQRDQTAVDGLRELANREHGNVVVYSGPSPFVGCGWETRSWSFPIELQPAKPSVAAQLAHPAEGRDSGKPVPFKLSELYSAMEDNLDRSDIGDLLVESRLYVDGRALRSAGHEPFLTDEYRRPLTRVDDAVVGRWVERSTETVRHYLCIQVMGWGGELIHSVFVRFQRFGQSLFIEVNHLFLPPVREEYHVIDSASPEVSVRQLRWIAARSARRTPRALLGSPFRLGRLLLSQLLSGGSDGRAREVIRTNYQADRGARFSLRELAITSGIIPHFQRLDQKMYEKVVDEQIQDAISSFLEEHGYDISALSAAVSQINIGNLVNGDDNVVVGRDMHANNVAAGKGSTAANTVKNIIRPAQTPGGSKS